MVVVGVGGMGSVACAELAARGARVLGLEQHTIGHALGSSHGETRLYRHAYFEAPDYVPLMQRALRAWRRLEARVGEELVVETGLALFGRPGSTLIAGAERAAREHALEVERLSVAEAAARFPELRAEQLTEVLFEPAAGFLRVDACVRAAARVAREAGAEIVEGQTVEKIEAMATGAVVHTSRGEHHARRVIVAAGPWSARLLGSLGQRLTVRRKVLVWLPVDARSHRVEAGAPAFGFDHPSGFFYGFPCIEPGVLKVAEHTGGASVPEPDAVHRELSPTDVDLLFRFVKTHLPRARPEVLRHAVCLYTMSPDEHFLVGRHPEHASILLAAGFSGHGFKFASAVAEALSDLALSGETDLPIGFLNPGRF